MVLNEWINIIKSGDNKKFIVIFIKNLKIKNNISNVIESV